MCLDCCQICKSFTTSLDQSSRWWFVFCVLSLNIGSCKFWILVLVSPGAWAPCCDCRGPSETNKPMCCCVQSSGRGLCLVCSSMCGALPVQGSVLPLWTDSRRSAAPDDCPLCLLDHRRPICALPFLLLYLLGEGVVVDVSGEISVTESVFSFAEYICWANGNVQMRLFMFACSAVFPPPSCLCTEL